MRNKYDVVVVGAGPIGSYTAYQLVDKGYDVCLLEAKKRIGENVVCAGVISKQAFKRYDLPTESILSRIDSFVFVSPHGRRLEYRHPDIFAYVVDRGCFDKALLKLAQRLGADVQLDQRVTGIEELSHQYTVICKNKKCQAKAVVLATGVDYALHTSLGFGKPAGFLCGAQIEMPLSMPLSQIEIHIGQNFAPGSFGWTVPIDQDSSRIGVIVEKKAKVCLDLMLKQRLNFTDVKYNQTELKEKPIAFGPIKRSVKNKILAVGEAAGQVKTTTGGGIFYGLLCSEIAVDKLNKTLKNGKDLNDYEVTWRSALISELDIGRRLREIAHTLDDDAIENLFKFVKQHNFWVELLIPRINFDYHSNFLFYCLKSFESVLKK